MCNDYEQHILWGMWCDLMQAEAWCMPTDQRDIDLTYADDFRIQDIAPVARPAGPNVVGLAQMRWGPMGPRGPIPWLRSEGRSFANSKRCIVPATAFFEFTGKTTPKAKHRFSFPDSPILGIAATWKPGEGNNPPAFSMLTTGPGPDIAPYHDRQLCVLRPSEWADWFRLSKPEGELLRPQPAGGLAVETVREGSG